jgi:phage shock protein E
MKTLLLVVSLFFSTLGFAQSQANNEIWIDVRTAEEYAAGHVPTATNIPFGVIAANINSLTTDKNARIHLYCKSGRRADIALKTLQSLGYTKVTNEGGYQDLKAK